MSQYYRENPDEPIRHDWLEGVPHVKTDAEIETEIPCNCGSLNARWYYEGGDRHGRGEYMCEACAIGMGWVPDPLKNRIADLELALRAILATAPRIGVADPNFHMALWDAENLLSP